MGQSWEKNKLSPLRIMRSLVRQKGEQKQEEVDGRVWGGAEGGTLQPGSPSEFPRMERGPSGQPHS